MTYFYLAVAALLAVTLALLLRPWWLNSRQVSSANSDSVLLNLNAAVHRDRLTELDRDHANGSLSATDLIEAQSELKRQLIDDTQNTGYDVPKTDLKTQPTAELSLRSGVLVALVVILGGFALYAQLGNPTAVLPSSAQAQVASQQIEVMVTSLANKMEKNPTPEGLAMLARSYKSLGRLDEAEKTYERLGADLYQNAALLAEFAEALAQKGGFAGRPRELLKQSLQLEPNNMLALFLSGADASEEKRYAEAIGYWEKLMPQFEPGSEDAQMVSSAIAIAKERGGLSGAGKKGAGKAASRVGAGDTVTKTKSTASAKSVSGRVELSAALKGQAKPDDVLFIFARSVGGSRMPLAAQRARVADLPFDFVLDDSLALSPTNTISSVNELHVEARISKTGQAMPGKGDLTGKSALIKLGTKPVTGIKLRIDTVNE